MADVKTFNRFELKYLMPAETARATERALAGYVAPDGHAGRDGSYPVHSVYWDSPDLRFFWEKVEGVKVRRKLRFRRYADSADVFLEIKQRNDRTVQKRRSRIALASSRDWFVEHGPASGAGGGTDPAIAEAEILWRSLNLRPAVGIHYRRRPFFAVVEPGLRITFDSELRWDREALDIASPWAGGRPMLDPQVCVMEVKFNDAVPTWLARIVSDLGLRASRMSKYARAVDLWRFGGRNT